MINKLLKLARKCLFKDYDNGPQSFNRTKKTEEDPVLMECLFRA